MTLTDLIKSAEEKLANPDLTLGTRRREEAILHHLTNLERTVTELESQNTELYVDLCEMGDMARERSRKAKLNDWALNFIDTITNGMNSDTLIRHKWPDGKPEEEKSYWARVEINGAVSFLEMYWSEQLGWHTQHGKYITHWWNLPEVTE